MGLPESGGITLSDHIDTMILRALIDRDDDPDLVDGAHKLLQRSNGPLEVCHVSIGEAFATMAEDEDRQAEDLCGAAQSFRSMLETGSLKICGFHNHKETHSLALRLHKEDDYLEANDGIILANALLCDECHTFYTRDSQMLVSRAVKSIAEEYETAIKSPPVVETHKNRRRRYG